MVGGVTFEEEIRRQVADGHLALHSLSKEDKHLSGEYVNEFGETAYDTGLMFEQILERNYDKWREDLAALPTIEAQDTYYRSVIYPHLKYLEWRVEDRHADQRDGREYESMLLYDDSPNDLIDMVYEESPDDLHELVTDPSLCLILKGLTPAQKEVLYISSVLEYSTQIIAVIKKTSDRNVLKTKDTALTHIRGQYLPVVMFKYKVQTDEQYKWLFVRGISTTFGERLFAATIGEECVDYYDGMTFDFVPIIKDYRAQLQRIQDSAARLRDEKRRRKERDEKIKVLQNALDDGKMITDDYSYDMEVTADNAQDI